MKESYLISDIDSGFWSDSHNSFRGYLYAVQFPTEEDLIRYAKNRGIGVFKITKIYDSRN